MTQARNLEDLDFEAWPSTDGGRSLGCTPYISDEKGLTVAVQFYYQGDLGTLPFEHINGSTSPNGLNLWGPNAFFVPAAGPPPGPAPPHQAPPTQGHHQGPVAGVTQNGTVYYHQPTVCHFYTDTLCILSKQKYTHMLVLRVKINTKTRKIGIDSFVIIDQIITFLLSIQRSK